MSSAPSVPGVEVGAPWLGGCEHVLAAGALEMLPTLNGTFGPRRAELPESRGPRRRASRGVLPEFPAGPEDAQQGRWIPVARIAQVFDASVQGVPVGYHLGDALGGAGHAGLALDPDDRFGLLALFTKEYVHARRLPAGL
jgi:hypothetical protein